MTTSDLVFPISEAVLQLISQLKNLRDEKVQCEDVQREVQLFITSLNENKALLESRLPAGSGIWAIDLLKGDLEFAANDLHENVNSGAFKTRWSAKQISERLQSLRQRIAHSFQTKLLLCSLQLTMNIDQNADVDKRMEEFTHRMLRLSSVSDSVSQTFVRSEMRQEKMYRMMRAVLAGRNAQLLDLSRLQELATVFRSNDNGPESTLETQKFVEDVMFSFKRAKEGGDNYSANVSYPWSGLDDENPDNNDIYFDPYTCELMCDPVIAEDGQTYDRLSVLEHNKTQSAALKIVGDIHVEETPQPVHQTSYRFSASAMQQQVPQPQPVQVMMAPPTPVVVQMSNVTQVSQHGGSSCGARICLAIIFFPLSLLCIPCCFPEICTCQC